MALAILEPLGERGADLLFRIDTGTNPYHQLKIGRKVRARHGIDWVDDVYFSTTVATNPAAGELLDSSTVVRVPTDRIESGRAYAQLYTFKSRTGRSPAYSDVVLVGTGPAGLLQDPELLEMSTTASVSGFAPVRRVPCRTGTEVLAHQASVGDLLGQLVRLAAPAVLDLLRGTSASAPATPGGSVPPAAASTILDAVLRALTGGAPVVPVSTPHSIDNRFSRPFVFGVDDALLASLVGPLVQVLPQLANAANQRRVQLRQADNKLIGDILSDIERRRLLEQVLAAQPAPSEGGESPDLTELLRLLQQVAPPSSPSPAPAPSGTAVAAPAAPAPVAAAAPVPPAAPAAPAPPPATVSRPASVVAADAAVLSRRAVVSFVTAPPVPWLGGEAVLYARYAPLRLRLRLDVGPPVPTRPLPKALATLTLKHAADESVLFSRTYRLRDVVPNTELALDVAPDDLTHVPAGARVVAVVEVRWPSAKSGAAPVKALGSTDLTFVDRWFVKEQGAIATQERELTDLQQYRAFWNKVWESPVLDAATGGPKRLLWKLDVTAKYSILLTADHDSNGVMETKVLRGTNELDTVSDRTDGRMKAGIELSIAELNKLLPLWNGETPLSADRLAAINLPAFARDNATEAVHRLRLEGKARQRGMVWVGPVLGLVDLTLGSASAIDDSGQVTAVAEEKVRFPLPVAARVIGVRSE